ncbi:MAG: hypothetical protein ACR2OB_13440 [Solirubrobacteraceae bacterium]
MVATPTGEELVARCHERLEVRLVEHSGVPYTDYARHARQLLPRYQRLLVSGDSRGAFARFVQQSGHAPGPVVRPR